MEPENKMNWLKFGGAILLGVLLILIRLTIEFSFHINIPLYITIPVNFSIYFLYFSIINFPIIETK